MIYHSQRAYLILLTCFSLQVSSELLRCEPVSEPDSSDHRVQTGYDKPAALEDQLRVVPDMARIRRAPGLNSIILGLAPRGLLVQPVARAGDWYRVTISASSEGWIRADLLEPAVLTPVSRPQLGNSKKTITAKAAPEPATGASVVPGEGLPAEAIDIHESRSDLSITETPATGSNSAYLLSLFLSWTLFVAFSALGLAVLLPRDAS